MGHVCRMGSERTSLDHAAGFASMRSCSLQAGSALRAYARLPDQHDSHNSDSAVCGSPAHSPLSQA